MQENGRFSRLSCYGQTTFCFSLIRLAAAAAVLAAAASFTTNHIRELPFMTSAIGWGGGFSWKSRPSKIHSRGGCLKMRTRGIKNGYF